VERLKRRAIISHRHEVTPEDAEFWISKVTPISVPLICDTCGEGTLASMALGHFTQFEEDENAGQLRCGCGNGALRREQKPKQLIEVIKPSGLIEVVRG
jgi:hypothetical protein